MKKYFVFGGAIGDSLLGIHLARVVKENEGGAPLTLVSMRENVFVKELVAMIPFASYQVLRKESITSWVTLPLLALRTSQSVVYEPTSGVVPVWWALVLWCMRLRGGVQVRYHMHTHEHAVPGNTTSLSYTCSTENLFDTVYPILSAWGVSNDQHISPALPQPLCKETHTTPYILFHFFAGQYRRSYPVEKARDLLLKARTRYPEHDFILTCGPGERARVESMGEGIVNVRIEVNLPASELLCRIVQAETTVGAASGVTHMAAQLGCPVVVLCNLSDPCWLPSYAENASLLYDKTRCGCSGNKSGECSVETTKGSVYCCLYDIDPSRILEEMNRLISIHSTV